MEKYKVFKEYGDEDEEIMRVRMEGIVSKIEEGSSYFEEEDDYVVFIKKYKKGLFKCD